MKYHYRKKDQESDLLASMMLLCRFQPAIQEKLQNAHHGISIEEYSKQYAYCVLKDGKPDPIGHDEGYCYLDFYLFLAFHP